MKVVHIVGARPQFIKVAMLYRALQDSCRQVLVHTGQHYDDHMSRVFFEELSIPQADINLNIHGGSHGEQTGAMLAGIEKALLQEAPGRVVVYGDTNSTLAGGLAAAKLGLPLAHVEAGLRSFNRAMPEEINRVVVDHLADLLLCPTPGAQANLAAEGVTRGVHVAGDVMYDALLQSLETARRSSRILQTLGLDGQPYALATVHRAANTDDPRRLEQILAGLDGLGLRVVFPVHPRTRKVMETHHLHPGPQVTALEPLPYLDNLLLQAHADCILTDSGGIQKEAYWLGVRCITLRDETEWVETVEAGWNVLAGADTQEIIRLGRTWRPAGDRPPVYGDGQAARKIAALILNPTAGSPANQPTP